MEVLTSKNRMSATTFLSLYISNDVFTGLFLISNGLAITQYSEDLFITSCLVSCFLLLCVLALITYLKSSILEKLVCIGDFIKCTYFYAPYILKTLYGLYIIWKNLNSYSPWTNIINNSKLAIYWSRLHHHMKSLS